MVACDVLIVGGGPAGSACAWKLRASGLRVAILDRAVFPRDKVCGGWITPAVLDELQIDTARYARGRVMQAITGFRIGLIGGRHLETHYGVPVSYGIRRCEFDDYLLKRCGAHLVLGSPFQKIERSGGEWIVNSEFRTPLLVGAGGTFCPVARLLGARVNQETLVAAQEAEFPIDESSCAVLPEVPELYFCPDMKGYGWCFRKGNVLNIGLGRMDPHGLSGHVKNFLQFLRDRKRVLFDLPPRAWLICRAGKASVPRLNPASWLRAPFSMPRAPTAWSACSRIAIAWRSDSDRPELTGRRASAGVSRLPQSRLSRAACSRSHGSPAGCCSTAGSCIANNCRSPPEPASRKGNLACMAGF